MTKLKVGTRTLLYKSKENQLENVYFALYSYFKMFFYVFRSIGSLLNAGLEEIMQKILGLTDISAEMSGQFCSLFNQV